jgi:hypothetical protein
MIEHAAATLLIAMTITVIAMALSVIYVCFKILRERS